MKTFLRCTVASLVMTTMAQADSAAFIVGNSEYSAVDKLRGGAAAVPSADDLDLAGFTVAAIENGDKNVLRRGLFNFVRKLDGDEDRLAVVLTGRFVHAGTETFLLPTDFDAPLTPERILLDALPLSPLLALLSSFPGQALLVLGEEGDAPLGLPFLQAGSGDFPIPQGVTVMRGTPKQVAALTKRDLPVTEKTLVATARAAGMQVTGYAPEDWVFLPDPTAEGGIVPPPASDENPQLADDQLWQSVTRRDELAGYRNYLEAFPNGAHANAARQRIRAIVDDPLRTAREAEEALGLSRDARRAIQRDLELLDFDPRGIDGIFGPGTRAAAKRWQGQNGFAETGFMTRDMIAELEAQASRRAAELEEEARERQAQREREDRDYWNNTVANGGARELRAYLQRYPDGLYADVAQDRLDRIEEDRRAQAAAQDRRAWDAARDVGSVQAYQGYLADFPQGSFADQAQSRIDQLQQQSNNRDVVARARAQEDALNLNVLTRNLAERQLDRLGMKPGTIDGQFDKSTRRAIRRYQEAYQLDVTGFLDQATVARLLASLIRQ
ncbi:peptidoglycan-binding protein [Thalassococcus sp. BH17M4-6]|uniref:peptidoglycan-binding domain-containing protein n=1 Tax=Thalassococcus sp. BH17M4-6 TaxID=3413148 RepID=UPI003BBA4DEF